MTAPHLHLGPATTTRRDLSKAHLPTGRIGLADVVELTIVGFGVTAARQDWAEVLRQANA